MPLTLTERTLDRVTPHPPLHIQLADHIRQAITTGDLAPGSHLPSEKEIATGIGVDVTTVRRGIQVLVTEGLLVKSQGKRTTVAAPPPVRELDTQRYRDELKRLRAGEREDTAAFVTDHGATWDTYTVDPIEYLEMPANEADAHYLGIRKGTKVLRRRMVKRINGEPLQIQRSTVLLSKVKGTVLADPTVQPYPGGTLAELYDAGLIPDSAELTIAEEVRGHMPNTTERRLLQMEIAGPVWNIVRVFAVDGVPVEVSRVIAPQSRVMLRYETGLT